MLKKAGIVVATATAGLLAVAPMAFADGHHRGDDGRDGGNSILDFTGNAVNVVPVNACNDQILSQNVFDVLLGKARGDYDNGNAKCRQDNSARGSHR